MKNDHCSQADIDTLHANTWLSRARLGGRLALATAVFVLGWPALASIARLFRPVELPSEPGKLAGTAAASPQIPLVQADPEDGFWSFAGCQWEVAPSQVAAGQLDERLAQIDDAELSDKPGTAIDDRELLKFLRLLTERQASGDGRFTYRLDEDSFRLRVVTQMVGDEEKIVAGAGALAGDTRQWALVELRRLDATLGDTNADQPHLLALPGTATRVGSRRTREGRVLFEMISTEITSKQLTTSWLADGWQIHPGPMADPRNFDCLCVGGGKTVRAWGPMRDDVVRTLVLTRVE